MHSKIITQEKENKDAQQQKNTRKGKENKDIHWMAQHVENPNAV